MVDYYLHPVFLNVFVFFITIFLLCVFFKIYSLVFFERKDLFICAFSVTICLSFFFKLFIHYWVVLDFRQRWIHENSLFLSDSRCKSLTPHMVHTCSCFFLFYCHFSVVYSNRKSRIETFSRLSYWFPLQQPGRIVFRIYLLKILFFI